MKSALPLRGGGDFSQPLQQVELIVVYEDIPTAQRAIHAVDRVLNQPEVNARARFRLWKLGEWSDPELRERAAQEAAMADILVLSMHGSNRLVPEAEAGLRRWIGLKRTKPCAFVISLDSDTKSLAEQRPDLLELRSVATRGGIAVMLHFGEPPSPGHNATLADIHLRANATSHVLDEIAHRLSPRWGINE